MSGDPSLSSQAIPLIVIVFAVEDSPRFEQPATQSHTPPCRSATASNPCSDSGGMLLKRNKHDLAPADFSGNSHGFLVLCIKQDGLRSSQDAKLSSAQD